MPSCGWPLNFLASSMKARMTLDLSLSPESMQSFSFFSSLLLSLPPLSSLSLSSLSPSSKGSFSASSLSPNLVCSRSVPSGFIYRSQCLVITLKWCYDENRIFPTEAILKHKQVLCMRRKMSFSFFKYLFSFQRYSSFENMQISQVMTSYTQPNFDQIWWKKISQPICNRNVWFFAVRFY